MNLTLKQNEALSVLSLATGLCVSDLTSTIFEYFKKVDRYLDFEACGMTLEDLVNFEDLELVVVINDLFPDKWNNPEIPELFKTVFVWGDGSDHPCDECGCEMTEEIMVGGGYTWNEWHCTNCPNIESNEPDTDLLPGGYKYNKENY